MTYGTGGEGGFQRALIRFGGLHEFYYRAGVSFGSLPAGRPVFAPSVSVKIIEVPWTKAIVLING